MLPGVRKHLLAGAGERKKLRSTSEFAAKEQALLDELHPKELDFVTDDARRIAALVARGGGKTFAGRARFLRRMMRTQRAETVYVGLTRTHAEDLMWAPLKDLCERMELDVHWNETRLKATLKKNGSYLQLVGADDKKEIEKLRGRPFHEVGIDEGASHKRELLEHLMYRIIGPRMGDYRGALWIAGTPGHILSGPFYDITRSNSTIARPFADRHLPEYANWIKWSTHQWSLRDNTAMPHLWAEALLQKEANGWGDDNPIWRREYLGLWAADDTGYVYRFRKHTDDGMLWNLWIPNKKDKSNPFGLPEGHDWFYVFGMDMGWQDPFALVILAYSPTSKMLYHVYEFSKKKMLVHQIAKLLSDCFEIIGSYPVAMVADTTKMGGQILAELAEVHGIAVDPAEQKNKNDAIELMNSDLVDGRFKTWEGSMLEEEMLTLQWDESGLKENKALANHLCDAAIYARRKALHQHSEEVAYKAPAQPGTPEWFLEQEQIQEDKASITARDDDPFSDGVDNFDHLFRE